MAISMRRWTGGGGTGIRGAESGMEGAESGVEGAEAGVEGRGAGVEGAGSGDGGAGSLERLGRNIDFFIENSEKMAVLGKNAYLCGLFCHTTHVMYGASRISA